MARKFEIQLKSWIPLILESYFTYDTLNTFEIVKHSGRPLVILGGEGQVREILTVLEFLVNAKFLIPKNKTQVTYFGVHFDSYIYDVTESFKQFIEQGKQRGNTPNQGDWIKAIHIENTTHNTVNVYNFNFTFALEKLIEVKAGLLNL